jgi:hypothetical protein
VIRASVFFLATLFASSLFAAGHDLTTPPLAANQLSPVVTGNGPGFTAAWIEPTQSGTTIKTRAVSAGGEPIGEVIAIEQLRVQSMAIAHSPSDTLIAFIADGNVFAERLSPAGLPLGTNAVTSVKDFAQDVAVAWNGSRYFLVWSNGVQLIGAFIAPDGSSTPPRLIFGEAWVPGQRAPANFELVPDVAWDGRNFITVFGEAPNIPCTLSACPSPSPTAGYFRVMRVSADGDPIDSSPLTISGTHLRAHVASSGAESLIALDGIAGQVSTIIAHDEGSLTLDGETPLFQWYWSIASAVTWDGATYTVGWRYRVTDPDLNWLGMARVTRTGVPFDYRVTPTGHPVWSGNIVAWGPSIAVSETGTTALAISEAEGPSSLARARLYLASELAPMPAPPPAPRNVVSYFGGSTARIDWQSEPSDGFLVEWSWDFGKSWGVFKTVSGDARTTTTVYTYVGNQFRVRAFGPGGVSEGTVTSVGSMQRRRAVP